MTRIVVLFVAALALSACNAVERPTAGPVATARDWQSFVTSNDRKRLREWRTSFSRGLAEARAAGHGEMLASEGALLLPDAAIGGALPPGDYRCRVTKLGARSSGMLPYVAYPAFACRVTAAGRLQDFAKLSGSQRQVGTIYPHDAMRGVFLGTLVLGDEARAMTYGADAERDLAGWVERIGERRWRLLLPAPRFESLIDVVEIMPT